MISRTEIIRIGVMQALERNARERRSLLKMIGQAPTRDDMKTAVELLADLRGENDAVKPTKRYKKAKTNRKHHNGLHWTQKPENKARLRALGRKSAATRAEVSKAASSRA